MAANGESSWFMKTRPMMLMTATSVAIGSVGDRQPRPGASWG